MKKTLTLLIGSILFVAAYFLTHKQTAYMEDQATPLNPGYAARPAVNSIKTYPIFALQLNENISFSEAN